MVVCVHGLTPINFTRYRKTTPLHLARAGFYKDNREKAEPEKPVRCLQTQVGRQVSRPIFLEKTGGRFCMIEIKNIRQVRPEEHDEVWAVVRSLKSKTPWMKQVQALSPSLELFYTYQKLKNAGQWNETAFQNVYVPQFLSQMKRNEDGALQYLNDLYVLDKQGRNIALVIDRQIPIRQMPVFSVK